MQIKHILGVYVHVIFTGMPLDPTIQLEGNDPLKSKSSYLHYVL